MAQAYSNPDRENDPHTLPDIEVFFYNGVDQFQREDGEDMEAGWYWWSCSPGCLPDGDPIGPYDTEAAALAAAREQD